MNPPQILYERRLVVSSCNPLGVNLVTDRILALPPTDKRSREPNTAVYRPVIVELMNALFVSQGSREHVLANSPVPSTTVDRAYPKISPSSTRNAGRLTHLGQPEIGDFRCRKPIGQVDCIEQDVFRFQIAMCDTHGMLRERARKHHRQAWRLRIDGLTMYCQSSQKSISVPALEIQRRKCTHRHALTDLSGHRDRLRFR